jgi:hypothetical protein
VTPVTQNANANENMRKTVGPMHSQNRLLGKAKRRYSGMRIDERVAIPALPHAFKRTSVATHTHTHAHTHTHTHTHTQDNVHDGCMGLIIPSGEKVTFQVQVK